MSRNLKALGLTLLAVSALGSIVAPAAQAETPIVTELKWPEATTLTGTDVTGTEDGKLARLTIGTGSRFIECTQAKQLSGSILESSTTTTLKPEYQECFANGLKSVPVTVTHNGCTLTATAKKESEGEVPGEAIVDCPGGRGIEVHVFENGAAEKSNKPLCTYDIPAAQILTEARITTGGKAGNTHDLTVTLNSLTLVVMINTGPGGVVVCGIASGAIGKGSITGKITFRGFNSVGAQAGITLG
jgi:hypothetical protein